VVVSGGSAGTAAALADAFIAAVSSMNNKKQKIKSINLFKKQSE
jgi:hypothetical protein